MTIGLLVWSCRNWREGTQLSDSSVLYTIFLSLSIEAIELVTIFSLENLSCRIVCRIVQHG